MKSNLIKVVGLSVVFAAFATSAFAEGDVAAGEKVFRKCKACHSLEKGRNKVGPSLHGVIGRKAGTLEGYHYSSAMKDSGLTWDEATLAKYLHKPKAMVPKTKMSFPGLKKDSEIQDVIAYIKANGG